MHADGLAGTSRVYTKLLEHYGVTAEWQKALDLFLTMQIQGLSVDRQTCRALMSALESGKKPDMAIQLLEAMKEAKISADAQTYNSALRTLAVCNRMDKVVYTMNEMDTLKIKITSETANAILVSCATSNKVTLGRSMMAKFAALGLSVDGSTIGNKRSH